MAYNQYDLANTSLVKTGILSEMYIPLWWYSSGTVNTTATVSGTAFIAKGGTGTVNSSTVSGKLHTLNSNWNPSQKFAFEASIYIGNSGYVASAELWDMTSNTIVAPSTISTQSATATVVRSGQFTLTPGHSYGVHIYTTTSSYPAYLTKASLIAFLN